MDEYNNFGLYLIEEDVVTPNRIPKLFSIIEKGSTSLWQLPKTQKVNYSAKANIGRR
jgi:hypothetical protein